MENLSHALQRELVEEILLKDKNFFASRSLEFNIFRYTSLFAVFAFSIQIIVAILSYINVTGSFTFVQFASYFISFFGLMALLFLYSGLTFVIKKSVSSRVTYLKSYVCEKSDYFSFSSFSSFLQYALNRDHSIKEGTVLIKQCMSIIPIQLKSFVDWFPDILKREEINNKETFGERINHSGKKIKVKPEKVDLDIKSDIFRFLFVLSIISALIFILSHSLYVMIFVITLYMVIYGVIFLSSNVILKEYSMENSGIRIHLLIMSREEDNISNSSLLKFKIFPCDRIYFEKNVKKGYLDEKIETPKGIIYIVDKVVWNKYGQLTEINT